MSARYIPRFHRHPTDNGRYQQLIREREVKVGRLMQFLEKELDDDKKNAKGYQTLLDDYRLTMRLIEAMEHHDNFTNLKLPMDNFLNPIP
jgi:hypothetical protein